MRLHQVHVQVLWQMGTIRQFGGQKALIRLATSGVTAWIFGFRRLLTVHPVVRRMPFVR